MRSYHAVSTAASKLTLYGQMTEVYLPHILVRCTAYTNSKAEAEKIAVCSLVLLCILAERLDHARDAAAFIDSMVDLIGPIMQAESNEKENLDRSEMLLPDERLKRLAGVLNTLDVCCREILVLYHIQMLSTKQISQIYGWSIGSVRSKLHDAEKRLTNRLARLCGNGLPASCENVCLWLNELSEGFSSDFAATIAERILVCLAQFTNGGLFLQGNPDYWYLN